MMVRDFGKFCVSQLVNPFHSLIDFSKLNSNLNTYEKLKIYADNYPDIILDLFNIFPKYKNATIGRLFKIDKTDRISFKQWIKSDLVKYLEDTLYDFRFKKVEE